jgi:hypothetical protein
MATRELQKTEHDGDGEIVEAEVIPYDLSAITRAEIDIQIATAKRYPRDIQKFLNETETLACRTEQMARACMYSLPARRKPDSGEKAEPIIGPSVRLAEIALHAYGNVRATVRVDPDGDRYVVARFSGMDLEKNVGVQIEVRRRIVDSRGRRYSDDMMIMTGNAASAIAFRNGIWKLIPAALIEPIFQRVREVAMGGDVPIEKKRLEWMNYWKKKGIKGEDVLRTLGVSGIENIEISHLEQMVGWETAIKEGGATLKELFAPPQELTPEGDVPTKVDRAAEMLRRARERAAPPNPEPLVPVMETKGDAPPKPEPPKTVEYIRGVKVPAEPFKPLPAEEAETPKGREPGQEG